MVWGAKWEAAEEGTEHTLPAAGGMAAAEGTLAVERRNTDYILEAWACTLDTEEGRHSLQEEQACPEGSQGMEVGQARAAAQGIPPALDTALPGRGWGQPQ